MSIVEQTMMKLFTVIRNHYGHNHLIDNEDENEYETCEMYLKGKHIGCIASGDISNILINSFAKYDVKMNIHNPYSSLNTNKSMEIDGTTYYSNIEEMLPHLDIITIHHSLTENRLFDMSLLKQCKDGVFIIDTTTGAVDKNDIEDATQNGKVGGYFGYQLISKHKSPQYINLNNNIKHDTYAKSVKRILSCYFNSENYKHNDIIIDPNKDIVGKGYTIDKQD